MSEMSWTKEQVQEAVTQIYKKATTDAAYRKRLLQDPYGAIKEVAGKEVPQSFKINVIDGTGYHANIVLPALRKQVDELTDTELEAVAGGMKDIPLPYVVKPETLGELMEQLKNGLSQK